jgi:prepilin-type N-terminal cleavage/methylation domain-containing protein
VKLKNRRGDTLIEVIFALAILATILTVVTSGAITAWRTSRAAGERAQAAAIATEQVEALRSYKQASEWVDFRDTVPAPGTFYHMEISGLNDPDNKPFWELKLEKKGGDELDTPLPGATIWLSTRASTPTSIDIEVTVTWKTLGSSVTNKTTQLVTLSENK